MFGLFNKKITKSLSSLTSLHLKLEKQKTQQRFYVLTEKQLIDIKFSAFNNLYNKINKQLNTFESTHSSIAPNSKISYILQAIKNNDDEKLKYHLLDDSIIKYQMGNNGEANDELIKILNELFANNNVFLWNIILNNSDFNNWLSSDDFLDYVYKKDFILFTILVYIHRIKAMLLDQQKYGFMLKYYDHLQLYVLFLIRYQHWNLLSKLIELIMADSNLRERISEKKAISEKDIDWNIISHIIERCMHENLTKHNKHIELFLLTNIFHHNK